MDPIVKEAIDVGLLVTVPTHTEVLLRCEVCKCEITGVVPAASHLAGSKHKKAYKRYLAKLSDESCTTVLDDNKHRDTFVPEDVTPELKALVKEGTLEEFVNNGFLHFRCTLCYCEMSGTVPTMAHIDGGPHKKKLNAAFLRQAVGNSSLLSSSHFTSTSGSNSSSSCGSLTDTYSSHSTPLKPLQMVPPSFGLDTTSEAAGGITTGDTLRLENVASGVLRSVTYMGAQHYECTVCDIQVSGDIPAVMHLQGKSHNKVVARKGLVRDSQRFVPASSSSSISSTDGDSRQDEVAHVTDSVSSICLSTDNVTAALAAGVLVRELFSGAEYYNCKVCDSASRMCGNAPAAAHLLGQRHLKKMNRMNMSNDQSESTADTSASSVGNDAHARALREGVLCQVAGAFQCRVCKISVTGIRSAEQHLIGGAHMQRSIKWRENRKQALNGTNSHGCSNGSSSDLVAEVDADDAPFHDASSSFSTAADNSCSEARAAEGTLPGSQYKIVEIDLHDEVEWNL